MFSCWVNWKRDRFLDKTGISTYYYSEKHEGFIIDRSIKDSEKRNKLTANNITTLSEKIKEFFKKEYEKDFENKRKEMSRT